MQCRLSPVFRARRLGVLAWLAVTGGVESANAEQAAAPITLDWHGPVDCSRADQVAADVLRLAGSGAARAAPVDAHVRVARTRGGFRVELETTQLGESGHREFEGRTCDEVADATALVLSVMLAPVPTTDTVKEQGFRPKPEKPKPVAPAPRPEVTNTRWGLGPRVGGDIGTLPRPTLFAGGAGWFASDPLRLEQGAEIWVPRDTTGGPREGAGALVGLWTAHTRGCYALLPGAIALEGCFGASAGRASGRGQGIKNPGSAGASYFALLPGIAARSRVGALPAAVSLEVPVALVRPAFEITGYGQIYRTSLFSLRATLAVDWSP
jgi:hypothetical protein